MSFADIIRIFHFRNTNALYLYFVWWPMFKFCMLYCTAKSFHYTKNKNSVMPNQRVWHFHISKKKWHYRIFYILLIVSFSSKYNNAQNKDLYRRATYVRSFEVSVLAHVALRMLAAIFLASQWHFLAIKYAVLAGCSAFWPVNCIFCIKKWGHVAPLSGPSVTDLYSVLGVTMLLFQLVE